MNDKPLHPTVIDIDLDTLVSNLDELRKFVAPAKVMCILKANAYGHGLIPCARALEAAGADHFGVAFLNEALALRHAGIKIPILALGGVSGWQVDDFILHDIDITASSVMKLERIEERARALGKRPSVHLKIDTGMERIGTHYYTADSLLDRAASCVDLSIAGIFSHFACSEDADLETSHVQLRRFLEAIAGFQCADGSKPTRHISNSGGIIQLPEANLEMVRPGAVLYGINPTPTRRPELKVRSAFSMRSEVVYFKVVKEGAGVSYGHTWHAPCDTRVVTIPVGYGDGYSRHLSNKGSVLIRGKRYPIVGRVCMDQLMVNLGPTGEAYNGDEVVLLGRQQDEEITVEEMSALVGTDPRDSLVATNLRIPRRFSYRGERWIEQLC